MGVDGCSDSVLSILREEALTLSYFSCICGMCMCIVWCVCVQCMYVCCVCARVVCVVYVCVHRYVCVCGGGGGGRILS